MSEYIRIIKLPDGSNIKGFWTEGKFVGPKSLAIQAAYEPHDIQLFLDGKPIETIPSDELEIPLGRDMCFYTSDKPNEGYKRARDMKPSDITGTTLGLTDGKSCQIFKPIDGYGDGKLIPIRFEGAITPDMVGMPVLINEYAAGILVGRGVGDEELGYMEGLLPLNHPFYDIPADS